MKAISIRLEDSLGRQFDDACRRTGHKKNTLLTKLIAAFVRHQRASLRVGQAGKKNKDPFLEVIGLMREESLLHSPEDIDRILYDI